MKKVLSIILATILLFAAVGCSNGGKKGVKSLAGKTPQELYNAAIEYIQKLENYEILIESNYKTTYEGETGEESSTTLHKSSGDSFYYLYKDEAGEEYFLHDGKALYKNVNNITEKEEISYADFMTAWGSITESGMLIELDDSYFEDKLFVKDGDVYYLDFLITEEDYADIAGGTVESPVTYRVYFDEDGNVTKFERSMTYYYYDVVLVEDNMTVYVQNVGEVEKIATPANPEGYSVRVKSEDIDMSTVANLDLFEPTTELTDYVLLDMKVDGSVKLSEDKTVDNYTGKILIRLYPDVAPLSVKNFKKLVSEKKYDGLTIHRVIADFVIQGGDPNGDGTGGAGEDIFGEFESNGFTNNLSHKRGVVSMARAEDPDSGSSQFFICHADATNLDGNYAAFGYVVYGMDTVDVIAGLATDDNDMPTVKVTIESASFVKKKAQ